MPKLITVTHTSGRAPFTSVERDDHSFAAMCDLGRDYWAVAYDIAVWDTDMMVLTTDHNTVTITVRPLPEA